MTTVSTALLPWDALLGVIARLRPRAGFTILERARGIEFPGKSEVVQWEDCPKGRIFGGDVELRWEVEDGAYRAVLIETEGGVPPGFEVALNLDGAIVENERYFLWGEDDLAIGGRLDYSRIIPRSDNQKGRAELWVAQYIDRDGRMLFFRYVELQGS